jgi:hypothetical protein
MKLDWTLVTLQSEPGKSAVEEIKVAKLDVVSGVRDVLHFMTIIIASVRRSQRRVL